MFIRFFPKKFKVGLSQIFELCSHKHTNMNLKSRLHSTLSKSFISPRSVHTSNFVIKILSYVLLLLLDLETWKLWSGLYLLRNSENVLNR